MLKFVALRLLLTLFFVVAAIFYIRNFQPVNLPEPSRQPASAYSCVVSEEAAKVHDGENGEKNYEEAWIDYVNDDNTVQVTTVDTKLSLLFRASSSWAKCFRKGSMANVTITECNKTPEGECDFSLPHIVYVRTELVNILNWNYSRPAH